MGHALATSRSLSRASVRAAARTPVKRLRRSIAPFDLRQKSGSRGRIKRCAARQRVNRLLHAAENVVAADQREQSDPREALLRADGFKPRDRHVDSPAAQPTDELGEHGRAGVVDFDQRIRLDHDQLWRWVLTQRSARWRGENCRR